jgi:ethanolamine utilization protein EutN
MQLGRVVGQAVATVKHPSLQGWRLLVVQPLTADGKEDGEPLLAIDGLGAGAADLVIVSNDGAGAREMVGAKNSPVRWFVMGIRDA